MKWFFFILILIISLIPSVQAEASPPDNYITNFPNFIGQIGAGYADWNVGYPTAISGPGTYYISVEISTSVAAVGTLVVSTGSALLISPGCTYGTFVQDGAVASSVSGYLPV